ncbi:MAG: diaminopimelate epimerase [Phycisphaerae bacterium]|nr:diaminopimelate epimerase [Phycisphaerae bacterium]
MRFTKMHGLGNDYVCVNCFEERLDGIDVAALAEAMSDRHRGVGSDGLILIRPPGDGAAAADGVAADTRMEVYNADGSRAEMCGNGIRCVAKYVIDHGLVGRGRGDSREIRVQTDRGVLTVTAMLCGGAVDRVRVDMGTPVLKPAEIPVALSGERCVKVPLVVGDRSYEMTCVSMGNPHAVVFVESGGPGESTDWIDLAGLGPLVETHELFPNRVNLHIASAWCRDEVTMRTWERGSGLTQACGTGACAVLVAGVLEGRLDRAATVHLPGGDLAVEWVHSMDGVSGSVFVNGPAVEVYSGEWPA